MQTTQVGQNADETRVGTQHSPEPLGAATQRELGALLLHSVHSPDSATSGDIAHDWAAVSASSPLSHGTDFAADEKAVSPHTEELANKARAALASAASSPMAAASHGSPLSAVASSAAHDTPEYVHETARALEALQMEHVASPQGSLQSDALFDMSPATAHAPPSPAHAPRPSHPLDSSSEASPASTAAAGMFNSREFHSPSSTHKQPLSAPAAHSGVGPSTSAGDASLNLSAVSTAASAADRSFASHHSRVSAASQRAHRSEANVMQLQQQLRDANSYIAQLERGLAAAENNVSKAEQSAQTAISAASEREQRAAQLAKHQQAALQSDLEDLKAKLAASQEAELQARREAQVLQQAARRQAAAAASKPAEKEGGVGGALQQCKQQLQASRTALATAKAVHQKAQLQWNKQETMLKQFAQQATAAKTTAENAARSSEKKAVAAETKAAGLQKQLTALQRRADNQAQRLAELPAIADLQSQLRQLETQNNDLRSELTALQQVTAAEAGDVAASTSAASDAAAQAETRRLASELASLRSQRSRLQQRCQDAQDAASDADSLAAHLREVCGTVRWLAMQAGVPAPAVQSEQPLTHTAEECVHLLRSVCSATQAAQREADAAAADAGAARAHAHQAAVDAEILRAELERLRATQGGGGSSFGQPANAAQLASNTEHAALQEQLAAAKQAAASQAAKAEHALRKLAAQEGVVAQLRARVGDLMSKAEERSQRNKAAFQRVFGRVARPGSLVDAVPLQLTAAYEDQLQALRDELRDAQAMLSVLRSGQRQETPASSQGLEGPELRSNPPPEQNASADSDSCSSEGDKGGSNGQLPPATAESMLSTPHAHLQLVQQRALAAQLQAAVAQLQSQLRSARAETAQLRTQHADLQQRHQAAVQRSTASLDRLQGELESRPSAKEWAAARRRLAAVEAELQAAAEAGYDRAVLQLRARQSQKEAADAARLKRPGVLAEQDRTAHALHGLAPRLRALPRDEAHALLQEVCAELQVEDPTASPGAVRTLKSAVAYLPVLDAVVSQLAAVGVTARVATGAAREHIAALLQSFGADDEEFARSIQQAAADARKPSPTLPSTVAAAVQYLQAAVQHVLLLPALCQVVQAASEGLHFARGGSAQAMCAAFRESCATALWQAATNPPPTLASEPGMASWLQSQLRNSHGREVSTAVAALGSSLQQLVSFQSEHDLMCQAFDKADSALAASGSLRAEQAVLRHFKQALGVKKLENCIPALSRLINSIGGASEDR